MNSKNYFVFKTLLFAHKFPKISFMSGNPKISIFNKNFESVFCQCLSFLQLVTINITMNQTIVFIFICLKMMTILVSSQLVVQNDPHSNFYSFASPDRQVSFHRNFQPVSSFWF